MLAHISAGGFEAYRELCEQSPPLLTVSGLHYTNALKAAFDPVSQLFPTWKEDRMLTTAIGDYEATLAVTLAVATLSGLMLLQESVNI